MATQKISTSSFLNVNWKDLAKGLLIAVITTPLTIILESVNAGNLTFDWKHIGVVALSAGAAYLLKNFFDADKIIITNPTKIDLNAAKTSDVSVVVEKK